MECMQCKKRGFNPKVGVICSLTNAARTLESNCPEYEEDPAVDKERTLRAVRAQMASDNEKRYREQQANRSPKEKRTDTARIILWVAITIIIFIIVFVIKSSIRGALR